MTLASVALAAAVLHDAGRSLDFPEQAPAHWVAMGREWGESPTAAWRCAEPFQVTIGWRKAGPFKQKMEFAWWFSPGFVASRLGYLQRREYFSDEELANRWTEVVQQVDGRLIFLVQLAASPRNDWINGEEYGAANLEDLDNVRFVLLFDEEVVTPQKQTIVWKQRSEKFSDYTGFPWYQFAPGVSAIIGEFESTLTPKNVSFGLHHLYLYRVEFRLDNRNPEKESMSLRAISKNKERVADFNL